MIGSPIGPSSDGTIDFKGAFRTMNAGRERQGLRCRKALGQVLEVEKTWLALRLGCVRSDFSRLSSPALRLKTLFYKGIFKWSFNLQELDMPDIR